MCVVGCVINDFVDCNFDGYVVCIKVCLLVIGKISVCEVWIIFVVLVVLSFGLVLLINVMIVWLLFGVVVVVLFYFFMKCYIYYLQVVLGVVYFWGILMVFIVECGELLVSVWLLFLVNVLWMVVYDFYYVMIDCEDDLKIGIKFIVIFFGDVDCLIIGSLQGLILFLLVLVGNCFELGLCFYFGLVVVVVCFVWEVWLICDCDLQVCFCVFLYNYWVGLVIFFGMVVDYVLC